MVDYTGTMLPMLAHAAIVVSVVLVALHALYRWLLPRPITGIPYSKDAVKSILGSIPEISKFLKRGGRFRHWLVGQNIKHNSPLVQIWMAPFAKPTLVLTDYQEAQDLLIRRTAEFDRSQRFLDLFGSLIPNHHIAMSTTDSRFKGNRELVRDLMSPAFLRDVSAVEIYTKTLDLVELWSLKAVMANNKPFDARHDIFNAAMDIINAAAFAVKDDFSTTKHQLDFLSHSTAKVQETANGSVEFERLPQLPEVEPFIVAGDYIGSLFKSPIPKLSHMANLLINPKLRCDITSRKQTIQDQIDKSIQRLASGNETQRCAVDHILQRERSVAGREGRDPNFHSDRILDEISGYIVAGHETSSTGLLWMLKNVSAHQQVQERLRESLRMVFKTAATDGRLPSAAEIVSTNLPYLDAVIDESLRMESPLPIVLRSAMVDTTLLGFQIPKGTDIFIPAEGPGFKSPPLPVDLSLRSETSISLYKTRAWDEADMASFVPERWLRRDETGKVSYDPQAGPFLAFSHGVRGCFGKRLAYVEMRMVLALLVWNFRFKKLEGELASNASRETMTNGPKFCYISLERVEQERGGRS